MIGKLHFVRVTTDAGSLETLSACARSGARGWAGRTGGGTPSCSTRSAPRTVPSEVLKGFSLDREYGPGWRSGAQGDLGEASEKGAQGMEGAKGESFFSDYDLENYRGPRGDKGLKGYKGEPASES